MLDVDPVDNVAGRDFIWRVLFTFQGRDNDRFWINVARRRIPVNAILFFFFFFLFGGYEREFHSNFCLQNFVKQSTKAKGMDADESRFL